MSQRDGLEALEANQEIKIAFDPPGDGNCQFEALSHQLSVLSIYKGASKLREDAVQQECL